MPYPYAEARCLFHLGAPHMKRQDRQAARSSLEAALAIFNRLGATKDVAKAENCLAESVRV
jgi:hypothetical protein